MGEGRCITFEINNTNNSYNTFVGGSTHVAEISKVVDLTSLGSSLSVFQLAYVLWEERRIRGERVAKDTCDINQLPFFLIPSPVHVRWAALQS